MNELPILYSFRRCPYAMRARMALWISDTEAELREVKLADKPAALLETSPKGTVPVLALPGGRVIEESLAIMRWALARHDPENWLAGEEPELIARNDGPFKHHLDRYKYDTRYDSDAGEHRAAALGILQELDDRLIQTDNLCGPSRSLADIAIFPFVRQFANHDRGWFDALPLRGLQRWLDRHLDSDLFRAVMDKHDPWSPGDEITIFRPVRSH
jgi:glutathione S-transferase